MAFRSFAFDGRLRDLLHFALLPTYPAVARPVFLHSATVLALMNGWDDTLLVEIGR